MLVFKFGGASVHNAAAVRNVAEIIRSYKKPMIIVVSAMDKITNALEALVDDYFNHRDYRESFISVKSFHYNIIKDLFKNNQHIMFSEFDNQVNELKDLLSIPASGDYDYEYDRVVSFGELLSTKIISFYLNDCRLTNQWVDIRNCLKTDDTFREGHVIWDLTPELMLQTFSFHDHSLYVTQGFIGSTVDNNTTTLGREGSDFSAAIIAYSLNAKQVVIWKDVPGLLNADPKWFDNTKKLNNISYQEAVELAYYGATIIHPKTIKPLQNKNIPLYVKSFLAYSEEGTLINHNTSEDSQIPSFIFRMKQALISFFTRDYSFIIEENLSEIFAELAKQKIKINVMQNSAISFSVSMDDDAEKLNALAARLREKYKILYNKNCELVTIRHYDQSTLDRVTKNKTILLEQKSRHTACLVMKNK